MTTGTEGTTKVARYLRAAAGLIEAHGLAHGTYEDDEGRLCAYGAIRYAVAGRRPLSDEWMAVLYLDNDARAASRTLNNWVRRHADGYGAINWNDRATAAEVIAGLRAAADDEDARHTR
jgi:hypothetical protein